MPQVSEPIVRTEREARRLEHGAALVLDPLLAFLDQAGLGAGPLSAEEIGDGHSNLSFLLRRGDERFVLRRPPRGPIARSANDVIRESRVLSELAGSDVPVPTVLTRCEDPDLIGSPFFVMSFVDGVPLNDGLPDTAGADAPAAIGRVVVDALVKLHAVDVGTPGMAALGRREGYLERQVRRFSSLLETNATRPLPDLEFVAAWLADNLPESTDLAMVHGDYRLGNLLFSPRLELGAVIDWEMATLGDPLADLGYLTATWAEAGDADNPMFAASRVTAEPGFQTRSELVEMYAVATGRGVETLGWYQALAYWKSAIFLEGSYKRFTSGASNDPFFAQLDRGVPALARCAREAARRYELDRPLAP